jgi:long-subunit acyl-CoA synthetase (AMP-forming)
MLMRRSLRRHLGLHKVEKLVCHGGSPRPETERLFAALHLSIITSYGITELCGWSFVKEGTGSWTTLPGQGYQLAGDGELLLSLGQSLSATGDIASDAGGQVQLLGRKTGPRNPEGTLAQRIERDIALCRYVSHAAVWRRGLGWDVVVSLDPQATGDWARRQGHSYTSFRTLAEHSAVQEFVRSQVAAIVDAHAGRGASTQVHILNEPLRRDDGTLTATGSLRRTAIERIYEGTISPAGRELSNAVSG